MVLLRTVNSGLIILMEPIWYYKKKIEAGKFYKTSGAKGIKLFSL